MDRQAKAAADFAAKWASVGDEKQDSQRFWIELLQKVYGIDDPASFVRFEQRVKLSHVSYIDVVIPATHTIIEQKSLGKALDAPIKQSDGTFLKPFEQAQRYASHLPYSERPRWIVSCNFSDFLVYDMEHPNAEPQHIALADLGKEYYRLAFLVDVADSHVQKELDLSRAAGTLVGKIYNALLPAYGAQPTAKDLQDLNKFIVRLVFCFYAEDAGLFGPHNAFQRCMETFRAENFRLALITLFRVLDQKEDERDRFLDPKFAVFPYVNGSLFTEDVPIPPIDEPTRRLILEDGCGFDWSQISPTIFGSIFEGTLNPETRRHGGMHYTSPENIHKVIDPLFLDGYRAEFRAAMDEKQPKRRLARLRALQDALGRGRYFDPACGSGNFLTEAYLSLRRLENDILRETLTAGSGTGVLGFDFGESSESDFVKVRIQQFYGIEINDFACAVAKTALWIAESQMFHETEDIIHRQMDFLPLKANSNIHEGNALQIEWTEVLAPGDDVKIMGNPPFVGASMMSAAQKKEAVAIFGKGRRTSSIDYVGAWYYKAAAFMQGTSITAAFVSTNSITQGEQVAAMWKKLLETYHVTISFAYRTFQWSSESFHKAAVHCVIIGFTCGTPATEKWLFTDQHQAVQAENINPYLVDAPDILIESRGSSICGAKRMTAGNKPSDGGNFILTPEERDQLLKDDPSASDLVRRYVGSRDFINGTPVRYCLWLKDVPPHRYAKNKEIMRRLQAVKTMREQSTAAPTRAFAEKPYLFFSTPQTEGNYLCIPEVSSFRRRYIPIGFLDQSIIASNVVLIVPGADLYDFGVLSSNVHMAWMRLTAGRLKSDYRYSGSNVYNTFPWPTPTDEQRRAITETAQAILDARAQYPETTLADLYGDNRFLYPALLEAHRANDRAVMRAYGFSLKMTESDCVAELMKRYEALAKNA